MAKQLRTEVSSDRISCLPDPILCHILSFLPTKYAVGTSLLSPRWRYLFTWLPSLDFDNSLVFNYEKSNAELAITFSRFLDRVSTLCEVSHMDKFRLKVSKGMKASPIESAIRTALSRYFSTVPSACLPCLKILHLDYLDFPDSDSINRFISACPTLEDLFIDDCNWHYTHVFKILSTTLKSLNIRCKSEGERFKRYSEYHTEFHEHKLLVDAPSLKVLKIYGDIAKEYALINLQSLDEANIDVMEHVVVNAIVNATPIKLEDIMLGLVNGISHVKALRLCLYGIWSCKGFADTLPMFHNMTHLVLAGRDGLGWQPLHNLLHKLPKLEALTFLHGIHFEFTEEEFPSSELVPSCLLFHLKTIEFGAFYGERSELELVKYFLQNAKVPDKLMSTIYTTHDQGVKAREEVLKFPKCSKTCQVLFYKF